MAENNKKVSITDDICLTKVNYRKCTYLWIIEDYIIHDESKKYLYSLPFPADAGDDEFKWRLCLNPRHNEYDKNGWISLQLETVGLGNSQYHSIRGELQLSILNSENTVTCEQKKKFKMNSQLISVGFEKFIARNTLLDEKQSSLPDDRLTIHCELCYFKETDIINISANSLSKSQEEREPACLDDVEALLMNEEFADVTISVKGKQYPAHKSILIARSPVFKAVFRLDNMKEKQSNSIEIQDIDVPAFEEMLRYIYSGKVNNLEELAPELLAAADKYNLKNLKGKCEKALYRKLSLETVVNTLMLADKYHATNLKKQALLYIKIHSCASDVLDEENRRSLSSHPHLLLELIDTLADKFNSSAKK